MKIIISKKEATKIKKVLNGVQSGTVEALVKDIKDTNAISYRLTPEEMDVEITINEAYVSDVCTLCSKYLGLIVTNIKSAIQLFELLDNEADEIANKYIVKHEEKSDDNVGA